MHPARIMEILAVAEQAAIASAAWNGKGDKVAADQAATTAMREAFNEIDFSGRIVIGEGERDEAPMLYIGEELGRGGEEIDIAVDPLEGTNLCAANKPERAHDHRHRPARRAAVRARHLHAEDRRRPLRAPARWASTRPRPRTSPPWPRRWASRWRT